MGETLSLVSAYLEDRRPKVFLLRHGHVEAGEEKRYIGQTDYPLSLRGRQQAEAWHRQLSGIHFSEILASDLSRASETARIIVPDRQKEIKLLAGLREINLGEWENLSFVQVKETYPQGFRERGGDLAGYRPLGGESFADLQRRALTVCQPVIENRKGHVLIVAHAGVNRVILCHLLGMPLSHLFRLVQDYGGLNIIGGDSGSWKVEVLNLLADFAPAV